MSMILNDLMSDHYVSRLNVLRFIMQSLKQIEYQLYRSSRMLCAGCRYKSDYIIRLDEKLYGKIFVY